MRVSLTSSKDARHRPDAAIGTPMVPALDPRGPQCIVGSRVDDMGLPTPVEPCANTLFGPRGACLARPQGPLYVADTGHHRLMIWENTPTVDYVDADWQIGQKDFRHEGRNGKCAPGAHSFNVPTGVAVGDDCLAVADAWNHRVLIWHELPRDDNVPADVVLGQSNFSTNEANCGGAVGVSTLNWCYGVSVIDGRLVVCDTGNRRVLVWNDMPHENGQPADLVLGQLDFNARDENAGRGVDDVGMCWAHAVAVAGTAFCMTDAGNNRIMVWRAWPNDNGQPCDFVLGQRDVRSGDPNGGAYWPDSGVVNMPYAITSIENALLAADTANSRLVAWRVDEISAGQSASRMTGQPDFGSKGDNRWQNAQRDSLCWPYGLTSCGKTAIVADSGNNRVMLWNALS